MEDKNKIDSADYISLEEAKRIKLPFFDGLAAGFPSPAMDYQHESLDLNEKFVNHPEASYFVRVRGESMIGVGILDGDICLVDRQEEIFNGNIVVAFVNGGLTVKTLDTSTKDKHLQKTRGICVLCQQTQTSNQSKFILKTNSYFKEK